MEEDKKGLVVSFRKNTPLGRFRAANGDLCQLSQSDIQALYGDEIARLDKLRQWYRENAPWVVDETVKSPFVSNDPVEFLDASHELEPQGKIANDRYSLQSAFDTPPDGGAAFRAASKTDDLDGDFDASSDAKSMMHGWDCLPPPKPSP